MSAYLTGRNSFGRPAPVLVRTVYRYWTTPITALENVDYTPVSGTVAIEAGNVQSPSVDVPTLDDNLDEFDEILALGLEYVEGVDLFGGTNTYAVFPILDNDPEPTLSIADDTAAEVDGRLEFGVTLSGVSGKPITVDYATSDGSATAPDDYGAASGTLAIAAGQTEATISVAIVHDGVIEPDETMTVTLSNPVNVGVTASSATGTIGNSGGVPTASVADVSGVEDAVGNLVFEVTLDAAGSADLTVDYATLDATATAGSDYTAASGTLTFAAGEVAKMVFVPVLSDQLPEADEGLTLRLSNVVNGNLGRSTAAGTILDDDPALAVTGGEAAEADGTLAFAVTVTGGGSARGTVTVDYATSDGTATAGSDYTATSGPLTFPPGIGERTVAVPVLDDRVEEGDETVTLTLTGPVNAVIDGTTAVGTIRNDDMASTGIALSAAPARVSEDAGAISVAVTATLDDSARSVGTTVTVSVSGSGAAEAVDFVAVPDFEIAIPAEATSGTGTFTLDPDDDDVDEADEMLTVTGVADLPVTAAALTLADDDATSSGIVLAVAPSRVSEGAGSTAVTATATLDGGARTVETRVTATVSGSGAAEAVDFAAVPDFEIAIPAEATSGTGTFTLDPDDDDVDEADETVSVSGVSDLPVTPTSLTLADDDERPQQTFRVLLFESAANPARQGFLRVINHSPESGEVRIDAVDDGGVRREPIMLAIEGGEAAHFNSDDLENGNADKGLSGGVGPSSRGEWRLKLSSDLDIEVLAYARTPDGFVTTMHDWAPVEDGTHRVSFFNPGHNIGQASLLRLVNTGAGDVEATITGTDDAGVVSGEVRVEIPAGTVVTLTAAELESGIAEGIVERALGAGTGKWRLTVSSSLPLAVKSLLTSPPGYLANLSTSPRTPGSAADTHGVPLFPLMSAPDWQGVVRVVNRSAQAGEVRIVAMDDTAYEYEPLTLTVGAGGAAHFNSADLELGNADKGLSGSTGAGAGSWRLDLTSALDIEVLSYVRSVDGFLTPVHDLAPVVDGAYRVAFFNPASNDRQASRLRLINAGTSNASVTVTGVDDTGQTPGSDVRLRVVAGTALEVTSVALESGIGEGIEGGALGDGEGKWRLHVVSDRPVHVMSLLDSPTGHLTNLSTVLDGAKGAPKMRAPLR